MTYIVSGGALKYSHSLTPCSHSPPHLKSVPHTGASKGTPGDSQCVAEILRGSKNKEVKGTNFTLFVSMENKRIEPIKQSNKCVDVYI